MAWAELAGLWTLIFVQQSFARMVSGPEAWTQVGADRWDVLIAIVVVALLPPTIPWLVEMLLWRVRSETAARRFHAVAFGAAVAIFCWQLTVAHDLPWVLRMLLPLAFAMAAARFWLRTSLGRNFLQFLSAATPVVILLICLSHPTSNLVLPHAGENTIKLPDGHDTPVVLVVFDEMPLQTLLDRRGRIDGKLFPGFARLARHSTWYPEMASVGSSTINVLPTIMSGHLPKGGDRADLSSEVVPDNLCAILGQSGYQINAVEQITKFCGARNSRAHRLASVISPALIDGVLPPRGLLPRINWRIGGSSWEEDSPYFRGRDRQIEGFIDELPDTDRFFHFFHGMLPHRRWMYLPDGGEYEPSSDPWTWHPEQRDRSYQELMLQVGFVDREVGRLMDAMIDRGMWRQSLVIVTADHGLDLSPSRRLEDQNWDLRDLGPGSFGSILSVPLFVKFPGQMRGRVMECAALSADVAPTVLRQLGASDKQLEDLEGRPLQDACRDPLADEVAAVGRDGWIGTSRQAFQVERRTAIRLRNRLFGGGTFYATGGRPDLIGSRVRSRKDLVRLDAAEVKEPASIGAPPSELAGRWEFVLPADTATADGQLAVAANGRIVATVRAWSETDGTSRAGVVLPMEAFAPSGNHVELFAIRK